MKTEAPRIYLSPPEASGLEIEFLRRAVESGWLAPVGPELDAFEDEFARLVGVRGAVALHSGTAGLHLALILAAVESGDEVVVSDLTFVAGVNPVLYVGARPVFVDCERTSWNMDPGLLEELLRRKAKIGKLPKAVVAVHLYGQSADVRPILELCRRYDLPLVEDAAEALGATYDGRPVGSFGRFGVFSFNGNKIITTSGGGMLVSDDPHLVDHARKLASQARDPVPHYEHSEIGYTYRMSNLLAAVGRAQLRVLDDRVRRRREIFDHYRQALGDLPGVDFMPEAPWGCSNRWLTVLTVDPDAAGFTREDLRLALEAENIEARPVWKPMHLQPVFRDCEIAGGGVSEELFDRGLCLPSGSAMTDADLDRVVEAVRATS
jgi:dTDP-4-amino-4,6-dideoxygalactose transaminase